MISIEDMNRIQNGIFVTCKDLVKKKGADYNRTQQLEGDTLFNLRVAKILGVVDTETKSVLVRIMDKLMRLISLTANPKINGAIQDETVLDTITDAINYLTFLYAFYNEARKTKGSTE